MCVPELLLPPVKKIGCLAEKRPYLPQNMLSLAHITYRPLAHLVPCWLVVVAQDTCLLYDNLIPLIIKSQDHSPHFPTDLG